MAFSKRSILPRLVSITESRAAAVMVMHTSCCASAISACATMQRRVRELSHPALPVIPLTVECYLQQGTYGESPVADAPLAGSLASTSTEPL